MTWTSYCCLSGSVFSTTELCPVITRLTARAEHGARMASLGAGHPADGHTWSQLPLQQCAIMGRPREDTANCCLRKEAKSCKGSTALELVFGPLTFRNLCLFQGNGHLDSGSGLWPSRSFPVIFSVCSFYLSVPYTLTDPSSQSSTLGPESGKKEIFQIH